LGALPTKYPNPNQQKSHDFPSTVDHTPDHTSTHMPPRYKQLGGAPISDGYQRFDLNQKNPLASVASRLAHG